MSGSPSPAKDEPAEIVGRMAGEYRLGKKLGEGGFGAVYEAEHPLLKRRAAVKVLHRAADRDSDAVQRFVSEAQAVNQVRNRHIVDIFSFGKLADGRHFYVMDLLDGEPLDQHLSRAQKLALPLVVQILRPIAEALDRAHAANIVHRDLKPQNIFLSWDASGVTVPVLLDFGVAKLLGDSSVRTVSGTPIGTPIYMSPEQARGEKVDARADVYSLGVVCHELLTGRPPITGDTTIGVLMAHLVDVPPRVSELCPELPAAIDGPILRMLEKKPEDRPGTAGEALSALAEAARSAGVDIPAELPRLPRPEPRPSASQRPGEMSQTLEWADAEGMGKAEQPAALGARISNAVTRKAAPRWPWLVVLVVLGLLGAYVFALDRAPERAENAPATRPPPAVVPAEPPARAPAAAAPAPSAPPASSAEPTVPAAPASPSPPPDAPAKRKKGKAKNTHDEIPSDLESPF